MGVSIIPTLVNQTKEVVSHLPNILKEIEAFIDLISDGNLDLNFIFEDLKSKSSTLEGALSRVVSNTLQYLKQIIFIPVIFVVGVFDYNNIKEKFISKLNNKKLLNMIIEIKNCSYEFMKTYILITILLTIFSSLIFYLIGLPNYCLLGFVVGVTNIIPIIGPFIGGAICTIYAFTINLNLAIIVFVIVFIIQLFESNIITPYLQAKSTKNHTLEVILSLIVFGEIFGVFGMILSSLILSTLKIIYKYYGSQLNMAIRKVK